MSLAPESPEQTDPEAEREWGPQESGVLQERGQHDEGPLGCRLAGLFGQGMSHLWDKGRLEQGKGVPRAVGESTSG